MLTVDNILRAIHTIPVTIESLPHDCYTIREVATGTELFIQGREAYEAMAGDIAVSWDNTFELLLVDFEWTGTLCAWLSGEYADTFHDQANYNTLNR